VGVAFEHFHRHFADARDGGLPIQIGAQPAAGIEQRLKRFLPLSQLAALTLQGLGL